MVPILPAVLLFAWLFGLWLFHTTVLAIPVLLLVVMTLLIPCLTTYQLVGRRRRVQRLTGDGRPARFLRSQGVRLCFPARRRE